MTFLSALFAALNLLSGPPCAGTAVVEREAYAMGTVLRMELRGVARECGLAATESVLAEVSRLEAVLSSWSGSSEVGRLNQAEPGQPHGVSGELGAYLAEAAVWHERTGGAFDPGVGALMDAWDLNGRGRVPDAGALVLARKASGLTHLRLEGRTATRPAAAWWLDSGAFGKGAALRAAAAVLRARGVSDALLDFGGQLVLLDSVRTVAIADPRARQAATSLRLRLSGVSVSTTSSSERHVSVDGARYGHVLDPRTGRPVPAWGSVSVVAADALAADALSTALFVLGPDAALSWGEAHPEHGVVVQQVVGGDVVVRTSTGIRKFLVTDNDRGASVR